MKYEALSAAGIAESDVLVPAEQHFNHQRKLAEYKNPLLVIHAENDSMVDVSHGERNNKWAGSTQKRLLRFPVGNHNSIFGMNVQDYIGVIAEFAYAIHSHD